MLNLQFLKNIKSQIQKKITSPKFVKYCLIAAFFVFPLCLMMGIFAAIFFDPELDGFTIFSNYISNLASFKHTAIPHFLDLGLIITSICLFPVAVYFKKILFRYQTIEKELRIKHALKLLLSNLTFIGIIFALIGFFGVGFFSEDLSAHLCNYYGINPFSDTIVENYHYFFANLFFTSILFTGLFFGIYCVFFPKSVAKSLEVKKFWIIFTVLGIEMLGWPLIHAINYFFSIYPSEQFYEWFIFFTILTWVLPLLIIILRKLIRKTKKALEGSRGSLLQRAYGLLTEPKLVKRTIIIGIPYFLLTLIIGFIVAQFDLAGYGFMPYAETIKVIETDVAGYNIFDDVISNLGSYRFTPIPQIFNIGMMISSILLVPVTVFIHKLLTSPNLNPQISGMKAKIRIYLLKWSIIGWIIGVISLFGVGFFSKDVTEYIRELYGPVILNVGWHIVSATIFTMSMMLTSVFMGLLFIFFNSTMVKVFESKIRATVFYGLGIEMVILVPLTFSIMSYLLEPLWEWIFFILLFAWIIPFLLMLFIPLNSEVAK